MKQSKRKRDAAQSAEQVAVGASADATVESSVAMSNEGNAVRTYALSSSCTVRDSLAMKSALLDLITCQEPITIDVAPVERIDTAAMQLLCSFVLDRRAAGGDVQWVGNAEPFREAVRLLGLQEVLGVQAELMSGAAA